MSEKITLGLPWPWVLKRGLIRGDKFYFFAVSRFTFCMGGELLQDGFVLFLGPINLGWASISSFKEREAKAIEAQRAGTTKIGPVADESAVGSADLPK